METITGIENEIFRIILEDFGINVFVASIIYPINLFKYEDKYTTNLRIKRKKGVWKQKTVTFTGNRF